MTAVSHRVVPRGVITKTSIVQSQHPERRDVAHFRAIGVELIKQFADRSRGTHWREDKRAQWRLHGGVFTRSR